MSRCPTNTKHQAEPMGGPWGGGWGGDCVLLLEIKRKHPQGSSCHRKSCGSERGVPVPAGRSPPAPRWGARALLGSSG